jgi:uncharacterized protein YjbJ (UPF0337 family)
MLTKRNIAMDKDRIKGAAQKFKGKFDKAFGRLAGSKPVDVDRKIDVAAGTVRQAAGEARSEGKDASRDAGKTRAILRRD